jgi:SNF2 family DNA or RNA helicase
MPYLIYAGNDGQRAAALKEFKESKEKHRILMNPATGGIGLNINEAEYKIWYSYDTNLETYLQAMDRNHRAGQTLKVTDIYMKTEHSIDDFIVDNLTGKIDIAEMLIDFRKVLMAA